MLLRLHGVGRRGVRFGCRVLGRIRVSNFLTQMFARGSVRTAIARGLIRGGFSQGVTVENGRFAGQPFDWLTPYTLLVAAGLVAGYALLGGCWLMWKTQDQLHGDPRRLSAISAAAVGVLLFAVSLATPLLPPRLMYHLAPASLAADWR